MAVHWSLQDLSDRGETLHIHCENYACRHSAIVGWKPLIERFGPDYVFAGPNRAEFLSHFVCSKCGGKELGLIMTPKTKGGVTAATW